MYLHGLIVNLSWSAILISLLFPFAQGCNDDQISCALPDGESNCIDKLFYECDNRKDCLNGEDEMNCDCNSSDTFRCNDDSVDCYTNVLRCDGFSHCAGNEDEDPIFCATTIGNTTKEPDFSTTPLESTEGSTSTSDTISDESIFNTKSTTDSVDGISNIPHSEAESEPQTSIATTTIAFTTEPVPLQTTEILLDTTTIVPELPSTLQPIMTTEADGTTAAETTIEPETTTISNIITTLPAVELDTTDAEIIVSTVTTTPETTTMKMTTTTTTENPRSTKAQKITTKTTTKPTKKTTPKPKPTRKTTPKPKPAKKTTTKPKPTRTTTPKSKPITKATTTIKPATTAETTKAPTTTTTSTTIKTTTTSHPKISHCDPRGTLLQQPDGHCECKGYVTGALCDQCTSHSFFMNPKWITGCIRCFCNGVSEACTSSSLYRDSTRATFASSGHEFALITDFESPQESDLEVSAHNNEVLIRDLAGDADVYFWRLPSRFAGNRVTSYGGNLNYTIRYVPTPGENVSRNNAPDVVIRSSNEITILHYRRDEIAPTVSQSYVVPLLEENWQRIDGNAVNREHLLMTLADVSDIFIKATYTTATIEAALSSVVLDTASSHYTGNPARTLEVEQCTCPQGYRGTSCEECASGYKRSENGYYLGLCEPCDCNGHSDECDAKTGICHNCRDNTEGDHCEVPRRKHRPNRKYELPAIEIQPFQPQSVRIGEPLILTCRILAGNPTPTVVWLRRDGRPLTLRTKETYDGPDLIAIDYPISSITIQDGGQYECRATNVVGGVTQTTAIHVLQPPTSHILPDKEVLTVTEGDAFSIECFAEGYPLPNVQWERSDRVKRDLRHRRRTSKSYSPFHNRPKPSHQSVIRRYKAYRSDEGTYVCHAKNAAGESQKSITVRVEPRRNDLGDDDSNIANDAPSQDNSLSKRPAKRYSVIEGATTKMFCKLPTKNKPVFWIRSNGQRLSTNHRIFGRDLVIYNTTKSDAGIYDCIIHEFLTQNGMFTSELIVHGQCVAN